MIVIGRLLHQIIPLSAAFASPLAASEGLPTDCFCQGKEALSAGDSQRAIEAFLKAVEADNTQPAYQSALASAYRQADREDDALNVLIGLVQSFPDHTEGRLTLARMYAELRLPMRVVECLEPVNPAIRDYEHHHLLADAYFDLGRHSEAKSAYQAAIRLNSTVASDHGRLGILSFDDGRYTSAAESLERALKQDPANALFHWYLARAQRELGVGVGPLETRSFTSGKAGELVDGYLLLRPVPDRPCYYTVSPPSSALVHVHHAVISGLDGPEIRMFLAELWLEACEWERAAELFSNLADQVPASRRGAYHASYARALLELGRYEDYLRHVGLACSQDPPAPSLSLRQAMEEVAERYNRAGDLENYLRYLQKAVEQAPSSIDMRYRLGQGLWEAGKMEEAVKQWRIVLELSPHHPEAERLWSLVRQTSKSER